MCMYDVFISSSSHNAAKLKYGKYTNKLISSCLVMLCSLDMFVYCTYVMCMCFEYMLSR